MPSLLIARLTVCSSYLRNFELPAGERFDTIQFYLPDDGPAIFRIRTFAVDRDLHVYSFGRPGQTVAWIRAHLDRTSADILAHIDLVPLPTLDSRDLVAAGIGAGALEVAAENGFAFWNPDGGHYRTQSQPARPPGT